MSDAIRKTIAAYWEAVEAGTVHSGGYVWINSAEQRWECDEDCPHPIHENASIR